MNKKIKILLVIVVLAFFCWPIFGFSATSDANISVRIGNIPAGPPGDTTGPVISNIQVINISTDSATITWETDEVANSTINYGETDGYGHQVSDSAFETSHSMDIIGLDPATLYHFQILARDGSGNLTTSADNTFTTLSGAELFVPGSPDLLAISTSVLNIVIDPNENENSVTYLINETSTGKYLQSDNTLEDTQVWQTYNSWGSLLGSNIIGLTENTQYTFQTKAKNVGEETDWSESSSVFTLINKPESLSLIDSEADFITVQAQGVLPNLGIGSTALWFENETTGENSGWITSTAWTNAGLDPNVSYSYKVKARNGNAVETDFTDLFLFSTLPILPECSDGIDNDNDGLIDYPTDPGCDSPEDDSEIDEEEELPECSDGIDNDNDGLIDYPTDPGCDSPEDDDETDIEEIAIEPKAPEQRFEQIRETAKNITDRLKELPVLKQVSKALDNPRVEQAAKEAGFPAVAAVTAMNIASIASLAGFLPYLFFLFSEPFLVLFKKKRKKYGVVYDSITKKPIDLAILRLYNADNDKLVQTKVSDKQGRFSFFVEPGTYYIKAIKKGYKFPTKVLEDQKEDIYYIDLYHGENIEVNEKTAIVPNIPLDADKKSKPNNRVLLVYFLRKAQKVVALLGPLLTFVVLLIKPGLLLFGLLIIHLLLYLLFKRLAVVKKPKEWGIVAEKETKKPISKSVVRLYDAKYNKLLETEVTDNQGRYSFLVGKNVYYITAEKKGYAEKKTEDIEQKKEEGKVLSKNIYMAKKGEKKEIEPKISELKEKEPIKIEKREKVENAPHIWHGAESAQKMKEKMAKDFKYKEEAEDINIPWSEQ